MSVRPKTSPHDAPLSPADAEDPAPASLVEMLRRRCAAQPGDEAYAFLHDGENESARLNWSDVDRRSRAVAVALAHRAAPGERALLCFPPGLDFITAFFGCLYARVVAVPVPPPSGGRAARGAGRLESVARDAGPSVVLATRAIADRGQTDARVPWLLTDDVDDAAADEWSYPGAGPETLAVLQYTSGSTAEPRGVMVSHGNLLHNLAYAEHLFGPSVAESTVSWLPVTHDMGLIQGVLQPAWSGYPARLMAPSAFLQRPVRWLEAITRYRATRSGGPNFAYELCATRIRPQERVALDLSSWSAAFCGAEPIRAETLAAFAEAFAGCGFRPAAFRPSYGLAEATLAVTSGRWDGRSTGPVPCGSATRDVRVVIVDPTTTRGCADGDVGEVWVSGPSVARGYWNRPQETTNTFCAESPDATGTFLRTGDLGAVTDGGLVITGRLKEMLIVRGLKHFPQDLEHAAGRAHAALGPVAAAFSVASDATGDHVVLVAELEPRRAAAPIDAAEVVAAIRRAVADRHGIQLHGVALVEAGAVPMTTSGKPQRFACRDALLAGELPVVTAWGGASAPRQAPCR